MLLADLQCWITVKPVNNLGVMEKSIPPGGELSVALTRHQPICGSKPPVGGIFSFFGPFQFHVICP